MEMQQRIERLEKERWIYLGLGTLAVLAGLLGTLMGASHKSAAANAELTVSTLTAQRLTLKNGEGDSLVIQDGTGNPRLVLRMNEKGLAGFYFLDENKKKRQFVGLSSGAEPQVTFFNDEGTKPAAEFAIGESGMPRLTFYDSVGEPRQKMELTLGGEGSVDMIGISGKTQALLTGDGLKLFDMKGTLIEPPKPAAAAAPKPAVVPAPKK